MDVAKGEGTAGAGEGVGGAAVDGRDEEAGAGVDGEVDGEAEGATLSSYFLLRAAIALA